MEKDYPKLQSIIDLKNEFVKHSVISINVPNFTIGRSLANCEVIPFVGISREHCTIQRAAGSGWTIKDNSRFGIKLNGNNVNKITEQPLADKDILQLDLAGEFTYMFRLTENEDLQTPEDHPIENNCQKTQGKKRKFPCESEESVNNGIQDAKNKFNSSQCIEINNMEKKIKTAQQKHMDIVKQKTLLETSLQEKILILENNFKIKVQELIGKEEEVEKQRKFLANQNEIEKNILHKEMSEQISSLQMKIADQKTNEHALEGENKSLIKRLNKEREDFESQLKEVSNSKQRKLDSLKKQLTDKEQEVIQERQEKLSKEQEINELRIKMLSEQESRQQQIDSLKLQMALQEHVSKEYQELTEKEYQSNLDKMKEEAKQMEQKLSTKVIEHAELEAARLNAEEERRELQELLIQREEANTSNAGNEQSEQNLEKMQGDVDAEKHTATCSLDSENKEKCATSYDIPSSSSSQGIAIVLNGVNQIMESEFQCSICSDLFIQATTLNCSHTFCKHCIFLWKQKKNDCPVCRANITSECHSIAIDSFIDKLVLNLDTSIQEKRKITLMEREKSEKTKTVDEAEASPRSITQRRTNSSSASILEEYTGGWASDSGSTWYGPGLPSESSEESDSSMDEESDSRRSEDSDWWRTQRRSEESDSWREPQYRGNEDSYPLGSSSCSYGSHHSSSSQREETDEHSSIDEDEGNEPLHVPGLEGSYYGGYGHCYRCGGLGHWSPGCPF